MKKIIITLTICTLTSITSCGQNKKSQVDMDSIKSQSICILEETDEYITYLTNLVRIMQKAGEEQISYAGGDELFLRYEIWTIMKKEKNRSYHECATLHCVPKRIAKVGGGNYDTAAFYLLKEIANNYKNGSLFNGTFKPSGKWTYVGLASDNGIYSKIDDYFSNNKDKVTVHIRENIKSSR